MSVPAAPRPADAWDIVVVGAGPAGSILARETARTGCSVLLVDRHRFPRPKVCGGCLSARTVERLDRLELGERLRRLRGPRLDRLRLGGWGRSTPIDLPGGGIAVSRRALDAELVAAAADAGATFLPGHTALVGPVRGNTRIVELRSAVAACSVRAAIVVDASGLGSGLVDAAPRVRRSRAGRIGCNTAIVGAADGFQPGTVYMAVGSRGYAGVALLEDGALNVAAALDRSVLRSPGPGVAVQRLLESAGFTAPSGLVGASWSGTPAMWQAPRRRADERVFAIGDAAGYVEPFTGEGIGWAIESATLLAPLGAAAARRWEPGQAAVWDALYRRALARSQRSCRGLSVLLRRPFAARLSLRVLEYNPGLGGSLARRLQAPRLREEGI